jgi:hypothetical protein
MNQMINSKKTDDQSVPEPKFFTGVRKYGKNNGIAGLMQELDNRVMLLEHILSDTSIL